MAEYLLRDALTKRNGPAASGWAIGSAGTNTGGGRSMESTALALLAERRIDGAAFKNRRVTSALAHEYDLILTATREHRGQVAQLDPSVLGRIFTINQFAYLLSASDPIDRADAGDLAGAGFALIAAASAARSRLPARFNEDDLADPIGRPMKEFRRCADTLQTNIDALLRVLPRT